MINQKKILLLGIGGNTAQGVARSLRQFSEVRLIGADSDQYNVVFGLIVTKKVYLVPEANDPDYLDAISKIVNKENIDLIIPSSDPEVYMISKYRHIFNAKTFLPNHEVIEISQDKWLTYQQLKDKTPQPQSYLIQNIQDLKTSFRKIGGPIWLKTRKGSGAAKSFIVHTFEQGRFWLDYWCGYGEFIAQELLSGRNLSWIGLYKDSVLIASGGYHRLRYFMERSSPTRVTGNINVGVTIHDSELNLRAESAVSILDSSPHGVYTVDLKDHGTPIVTEFNAGRFHMSFYVYTQAGINLPYYLMRIAFDEEVDPISTRNSLAPDILTIRNTDNSPVFLHTSKLSDKILSP